QFIYNFNRWISGVVDLGAVHNGNIHNLQLDTTAANFLAGPRLSVRHWSRVTPYFQVLFGGVYATTSAALLTYVVLPSGVVLPAGSSLRATKAERGVAMAAGGGLELTLTRHARVMRIGW